MKIIVSIHQPLFLPWIGYWNKVLRSDVFVLLDCAQYVSQDHQNRNTLYCADTPIWITVPVKSISHTKTIRERRIDYTQNWQLKHLSRISSYYKKTDWFDLIYPQLKEIYLKRYEFLFELNEALFFWLLNILNINTKIILSSDLG